jgi:Protein of unknown function (DUF2459)
VKLGHVRALLSLVLLANFLVGWASVTDVAPADVSESPAAGGSIYVVRRGWHIDVGFAAADLRPPLRSLAANFPGVRYLLFGFGDRRYLLAAHPGAPALSGSLWPGRALILATALNASPADAFGVTHVVKFSVSARELRGAQEFVWHALEGSAVADVTRLQPYRVGPYEGSLYFAAVGRYSALHTCNTWAAEALQSAGLPVHPDGVIFASQLWRRVRAALAQRPP